MAERTSVLITSHLMEEVEVLCNRVGVLYKGVLRTIGSPHQLKGKFDPGINIRLVLKNKL